MSVPRQRSGDACVQHVGVERAMAREVLNRVHALGVPGDDESVRISLTVAELHIVRRSLDVARSGPLSLFEGDCHTLTALSESEFDGVRAATINVLTLLGERV